MRFSYLLLFTLISFTSSAAVFDGYYIGLRGDTVHCKFDVPILADDINYLSISEEIRVIYSNRKKKKFKAGQIRSFLLIGGPIREKFVSMKLNENYFFLNEENAGKLKLYRYFSSGEDGGSNLMHYVVQFPFRSAVELTPIRFRKQMLKYSENDSFFVTELSDRTWRYHMIDKLVAAYNKQSKN